MVIFFLLACFRSPTEADPQTDPAPTGTISGAPILETPVILGGVANKDVEEALKPAVFNGCNRAGRPGKLLVRFQLEPQGAVTEVTMKSTTLRHPETEACVMERLREVRFPPLSRGERAIVTWPIAL